MDEDYGYQAGDTWTDPNTNDSYIFTGSDWQQYDSSGGMGGDTTTAAQDQDAFYRSIGLDPATVTDMAPADKAAVDAMVNGTMLGADPSIINSIKGFFQKKDAQGNPIPGSYDWAKIAGIAPLAASAFGIGTTKTTGGYSGSIPKLSATRQQIQYNDPNRIPGSAGRQYFTDVQYATKGSEAPAQAASNAQAQGILSGYTPAPATENKWAPGSATPALAMPWVKPPVKAATGRYLRGPTDGMADKINTSIDDKQPAKLSHGEFVVPADVVSHLGNGNSDAGAKKLYQMMDKVRQARTGTKKQGKQINPDKYMPGGSVNKYAKGGIAALPTKKLATGGTTAPATDTTTSSTLSPWAGDYTTDMLGKGQALTNTPYQAYTGPLTAGASPLQEQAFAGASQLASTGYTPTEFTTGTFDTAAAQKYMNPYLEAALQPQMAEMRRQAQINLQPSMAKLTKAGGYGGGRQAIMESEAARNLLSEQNKTLGAGYASAFNKAMEQFNTEQGRGMEAQKASEASRQYGADYGLKSLQELEKAGATQRGIEAEGIKADKEQFEEQRDWPYKMVQYQQGLLQGLPITTQTNTQNMSLLTQILSSLGYSGQLYDLINALNENTSKTAKSPGTT